MGEVEYRCPSCNEMFLVNESDLGGVVACPHCNQNVSLQIGNEARPVYEASHPAVGGPQLGSYLVPAIMVTICCCWPLGIPAIVYAAMIPGQVSSGNLDAAWRYAHNSRLWCIIAASSGFVAMAVYVVFVLLAGAASAT